MPLIRLLPFLLVFIPSLARGEQIRLDIVPPLNQIRPVVTTTRFVVSLSPAESAPERATRIRVRLTAPESGRLFSTDFPLVEGKRLLEMEIAARDGKVEWDYVFPIRGVYRLEVESVGAGQVKRTFEIPVKEQRRKYAYLGLTIGFLFLFGFVAGRIFSGKG